jgi:hypothetical protein
MTTKVQRRLSRVQLEVLGAITTLYVANGREGLTVQEIADHLGKTWNPTRVAIERLMKKGKVHMIKGEPGSVRPVA